MTDIPASAVASLRARTGVSILECKKALEEANGDEEKAIEILRKKGQAQAVKKAEREQSEGLVFLAEGNGKAALLLLKCETDFVARDENFKNSGKELAQALLDGGEAAMKAKAEEHISALVQKLGENISIGQVAEIAAPVIGSYVHSNAKIGVLVGLDGGSKDAAKDVAMHAAAMNPLYAHPDHVSADAVEREKDIWREQLKKEGKPEAMFDKIMMGKEKKFREESSLVTQAFVKDNSVTVGKYLGDAKVTAYIRLSVF